MITATHIELMTSEMRTLRIPRAGRKEGVPHIFYCGELWWCLHRSKLEHGITQKQAWLHWQRRTAFYEPLLKIASGGKRSLVQRVQWVRR